MPLGSACLSALPKHRFPLVAFSVRKHHLLLQQLKSCNLGACNIRATVTHRALRLNRSECKRSKPKQPMDRMRSRMRPNRKRQEWISFLAESDSCHCSNGCAYMTGVVPTVANVAGSVASLRLRSRSFRSSTSRIGSRSRSQALRVIVRWQSKRLAAREHCTAVGVSSVYSSRLS